jgi:pyruvate dehydrogenase E1 component beta subunit
VREITYAQALAEALDEEMARNPTVFVLGEDVGPYGGVYKATAGLYKKYGDLRVLDTPISESAIVGTALGAAIAGMRPIPEIMFSDLLALAMDQIANQVAKARYMSGGNVKVPLVIRTNIGARGSMAAQHSQSVHAWFLNVPGIKIVLPSSPYEAKGLLKTCIRDDDPVLFLEHKLLYPQSGPVPEHEYTIPLGQARIVREGADVTLIAFSLMVQKAEAAARRLAEDGIEAEVIDPRSLTPLDFETIARSVSKTGRAVVVDEGCLTGGITAEIAARISSECFNWLDAPVARVGALDAPVPFSPPLEKAMIPDEYRIVAATKSVL